MLFILILIFFFVRDGLKCGQFNMSFYMTYLARWPDYFHVAEGPGNRIMGYSMISPSLFSSSLVFVFFFKWTLWFTFKNAGFFN